MNVNGDVLNALGAFLSGFGSVLTAAVAIRYERKRSKEECAERMKAFREGLRRGQ
jgi:hypothetical protein